MRDNDSKWMWSVGPALVFFAAAALCQFVMPDQPSLALADSVGAAALATAGLILFG